ncbi:MAG: hypothetical protein AB7D36_07800, partial [Oscillospiraceae bacterium]
CGIRGDPLMYPPQNTGNPSANIRRAEIGIISASTAAHPASLRAGSMHYVSLSAYGGAPPE